MSSLLLTCEHGGNSHPAWLDPAFKGHEDVLKSHRGYDIGALDLFNALAPLAMASMGNVLSRLCIEFNRSEHHPRLFSEFTKNLPAGRKQELLAQYRDYRDAVEKLVKDRIRSGGEVVHVAVHSFTPVLDGKKRTMDAGLLYDPSRAAEKAFCAAWRKAILQERPELSVRMNQPYKGISDGFPTALRRKFPKHYIGVELEVNQRFAPGNRMDPGIRMVMRSSLAAVLEGGW